MSAKGARHFLIALLAASLAACVSVPSGSIGKTERARIEAALRADIAVLASDGMGGRLPGSEGEARTLAHIRTRLEGAGFASGTNDPGNPWLAPVGLVRVEPLAGSLELAQASGRKLPPAIGARVFAGAKRTLTEQAEVVFVGRTMPAALPDLLTGKVALMIGDHPASGDQREALRDSGAIGVIHVMADQQAVDAVAAQRMRTSFRLADREDSDIDAYVADSVIAQALGQARWQELKAADDAGADGEGNAAPRPLGLRAMLEASSQVTEVRSHNLIARLPGTRDDAGAVLLLAHWDHLGECGEPDAADRLCNGAVDNASGVAAMLELASRLAAKGPYPRDIYVLATTAEEFGLLGARAFARDPPLPLTDIVAAFNFDTVAVAPRGTPVGFIGQGRTALDPVVLDAIERAGRTLGNPDLAERYLKRQDGWVLLQRDVPAVTLSSTYGSSLVLDRFIRTRYHQASDVIEGIELGGAIDDLVLHLDLVRHLATLPQPGSPEN